MSRGNRPARLRDVGEFGFIDRVGRRFGGAVRPGETGIGDDAALFPSPRGTIALSTDMLVEGTHFDLGYVRPDELGFRALSANLSDLAAVGATPLCYLVALAAPPETPLSVLDGLFRGMAAAARGPGVRLMGGDTCRAPRVVLSLTVTGRVPRGRGVLRRGARPGDILFVTGEPGWSFLGLTLLSRGRPSRPSAWQRRAMERHLKPIARWREGPAAARSGAVSAMIDVSDGILSDLSHILAASGAGAALDERAFRLSPLFRRAAEGLGVDPVRAFLGGGEDYELLMAVRPHRYGAFRRAARMFPAGAFPIGVVTAARGIRIRGADGSRRSAADYPPAFSHFDPAEAGEDARPRSMPRGIFHPVGATGGRPMGGPENSGCPIPGVGASGARPGRGSSPGAAGATGRRPTPAGPGDAPPGRKKAAVPPPGGRKGGRPPAAAFRTNR